MGYETVAAVDLGSNSFRLQIGRLVGDQVYPLDSLKEPVRLAAGLTAGKLLDGASQLRALETLRRFGERLRGLDSGAVRAVATNTLRVARNAPDFLLEAQAALGFPVEVIAGREEARLIYVGVAHTLPDPSRRQLVVDIGGGSTEVIVGRDFEPLALESLYMGCVRYSLEYFPKGRLDKRGFREAELAARRELEPLARHFGELGWERAVGSSGTARALLDLIELNGLGKGAITRAGLAGLRERLLRAGRLDALDLAGLRPDRLPVLPGGLAIMTSVFDVLGLDTMEFSDGALRLGVLYDLLGRYHHQDMRDATTARFMSRYEVDRAQAARVSATAAALLADLDPAAANPEHEDARFLGWAARLHEIGISVAHAGHHKHGAYIIANADMPGFSKKDQARLSRLVLAHRGRLDRVLALDPAEGDWALIFCLRMAALLHRSRADCGAAPVRARATGRGFQLAVEAGWLAGVPLTAAALEEEARQWALTGRELRVKVRRDGEHSGLAG